MYYKPNFLVKILAIFYLFKAVSNIYSKSIFPLITDIIQVSPKVELTNIKCTSMDPEYCYLKSVNRTYKYLSLKLNVYKVPVAEFQVSILIK